MVELGELGREGRLERQRGEGEGVQSSAGRTLLLERLSVLVLLSRLFRSSPSPLSSAGFTARKKRSCTGHSHLLARDGCLAARSASRRGRKLLYPLSLPILHRIGASDHKAHAVECRVVPSRHAGHRKWQRLDGEKASILQSSKLLLLVYIVANAQYAAPLANS